MTEKKKCGKCTRSKPLNDFHKHKRSKDGLQSYCKNCQVECARAYYQSKLKNTSGMKIRAFEKFLDKLAGITC